MLSEAVVERCHGLQCPQVANKCKYNISPLEILAPLYDAMLIEEKKSYDPCITNNNNAHFTRLPSYIKQLR